MKKFTFLIVALLVAAMGFAQVQLKRTSSDSKMASTPVLKVAKQTQHNTRATRSVILSEDFENGLPEGWTTIDADGDGYNWVAGSACDGIYLDGGSLAGSGHNSSQDLMTSGSFSNVSGTALTPDNWLVTPQITLPETTNPINLKFYAMGQDASW